MNTEPESAPEGWIDPDDAPELTDDFFKNGVWRIGDRVVTREEAHAEIRRRAQVDKSDAPKPRP